MLGALAAPCNYVGLVYGLQLLLSASVAADTADRQCLTNVLHVLGFVFHTTSQIYAVGGGGAKPEDSAVIEEFDPAAGTWKLLGSRLGVARCVGLLLVFTTRTNGDQINLLGSVCSH